MINMQRPASRKALRSRGFIFVAALLAAALFAWGGMQLAAAGSDARQVRIIDGDGQEHLVSLSQNGEFAFSTSLGTNTIAIENGCVSMVSADCPGHDCIQQGAIENAAGMIVCMPHKLIVSIAEEEN